jgi:hypothetical protein
MRIEKSSIHRAIFRDRIRDLFSQPAANSVFLWETFRLIKLELPPSRSEIRPSAETCSLIRRSKLSNADTKTACLIVRGGGTYHHKGVPLPLHRFLPLHRDALCCSLAVLKFYPLFGPPYLRNEDGAQILQRGVIGGTRTGTAENDHHTGKGK